MELKDIADALKNLVQIEVKTIVGVKTELDGKVTGGVSGKELYSRIDLLNGDITTVINPEFLQEPLHSLIEFQKNREAQSQQLIHSNIQALKELATLVVTLANEDSQATTTTNNSTNTVPINPRSSAAG